MLLCLALASIFHPGSVVILIWFVDLVCGLFRMVDRGDPRPCGGGRFSGSLVVGRVVWSGREGG